MTELTDAMFREVVETTNAGVWVMDADGSIVFANAKAAEILGYARDELQSMSLFDLLDEQGRAQAAANLERRRQGQSAQLECAFVAKNGSAAWVLLNASPLHDAAGSYVGASCVLSEITQRREVAEALEHRERQLAEAQRVAHLGSWEWNIVENRINWSDELYRIFGLAVDELEPTYEGFIDHVHADDRDIVNADVAATLETGVPFHSEYRIVRPSGEMVWGRANGEVVRDPGGAPLVMRGTVLDITEERHNQERLQQMNADLAAARDVALENSRLKSEFLATMSHEIRTPMNGVIGLTGLLLATGLDERQRQYAEGVERAGESLLAIINDILDFSKIEAGKLELENLDFDLVQVVEEAAELVADSARRKGLELVAYCYPDVPAGLRGDPSRLRQVLLNLAANAVKFTDEGEVVVRARLAGETDDAVNVRFEVVDTGIGIDETTRQRLFQAFSQADASTTRRFGGTGLGLAISSQLVAAMGGELEVESEPGRGSTFSFTLPFGRPLGGLVVPSRSFEHLLEGMRVLVVDDNATNRLILSEQLSAWDMRPDAVDNGAAALDRLRDAVDRGAPYDLAVLDMCMEHMDGLELARTISADPGIAGTRLMLLTSTADVEPLQAAQAGIAVSLMKPVRLSQLYDALMRLTAPAIEAPGVPATPASIEPKRGHLLVVEDNTTNQMVALGILEQLGYGADVAANGLEALQALDRRNYAAILMDCQMPEMDGYTATAEIRRRTDPSRDTPIIAMTAGAVEGDRERCLAAGMDDYITKPVNPEAVEVALSRWLGNGDEPTEGPTVDRDRLSVLRDMGPGDGSLLTQMVQVFEDESTATIAAIDRAAQDGHLDQVRQGAHRLRGAAANLGATTLADRCRDLEELDRLEHVRGLLARIRTEVDRASIALRAAADQASP